MWMKTAKGKVLILGNCHLAVFGFRGELIQELVSQGQEVVVAFPNGPLSSGTGEETSKEFGCRFIETPINRRGTNPLQELKLLAQYNNIIKKERPDVVLGYTVKCDIYGGLVCRATHTPFLANITGLGSGLGKGGVINLMVKTLYRAALGKSDCIYFQNEQDKAYFERENIKAKSSALLPGSGVNLERYKVFPFPENEKTIFLYLSRVMKSKGIDQFLDTARTLHSETVEFHICGLCEEDYEQILEKEQRDGTIVYHGRVPNVLGYIEKSHCILAPSFHPEGIANVLLEAAACGRPVLTTDRAGCRETVDDGATGFLIKEKDSADLIEKTKLFLSMSWEEQRQMGLKGREKIEKEFDRQIVVGMYMKQIQSILQKTGTGAL